MERIGIAILQGGIRMRQSNKESFAQESNRRLFSVDFHDFLEKEAQLSDVELAQEFHISVRDVQLMRRKMKR
jgi:hypothetical protein